MVSRRRTVAIFFRTTPWSNIGPIAVFSESLLLIKSVLTRNKKLPHGDIWICAIPPGLFQHITMSYGYGYPPPVVYPMQGYPPQIVPGYPPQMVPGYPPQGYAQPFVPAYAGRNSFVILLIALQQELASNTFLCYSSSFLLARYATSTGRICSTIVYSWNVYIPDSLLPRSTLRHPLRPSAPPHCKDDASKCHLPRVWHQLERYFG